MRYIRYTPKDIEILISCLLLAREGFTAIRNLGWGRYGLDEPDNPPLAAASEEAIRQNLNIAGQLAEALHNLPYGKDETDDLEYTHRCMMRFLSQNPQVAERYRFHEFLGRIKESTFDIPDPAPQNDD